jgi:site-specific DNA-methyltransferase (adenine-specific)
MPSPLTQNTLFYGDNLPILREYVAGGSVDLVYLDPPFNSARSYNVLFKNERGEGPEAQIAAFEDTWHWSPVAQHTYETLVTQAPPHVGKMVDALYGLLQRSQMMAYLVMMAARLVELHRVLKPTGSLYLHCDPTAVHYLKVVLDTIFGPQNFRNEIIWQRTFAKGLTSRQLPDNHDVILCYQKTSGATWNANILYQPYDVSSLDQKTAGKYHHRDENGRLYRLDNLLNPNRERPNLTYEFLGVTRVWRWTKERMQAAYDAGLVVQTKPGTVPQLKRYLDEQRGRPLGDVWTDIPPLNSQARERLGYPTQKPLALLERIIQMSSNLGDVVLDPFAGCGTAVIAAQKLGRRWIGIDVTHLAIALLKYRLKDQFGEQVQYQVRGEPEDVASAHQLALDDRYQYQWWALSLVEAKPLGGDAGSRQGKKGSDQGIDGVITFLEDAGRAQRVLVQVKSGKVGSPAIRDLVGTLDREKAAIGVFVTLEEPTRDMRSEAVAAGSYHSPAWGRTYPRVQILTIAELLRGAAIQMPPQFGTFRQAPRVAAPEAAQGRMVLE